MRFKILYFKCKENVYSKGKKIKFLVIEKNIDKKLILDIIYYGYKIEFMEIF